MQDIIVNQELSETCREIERYFKDKELTEEQQNMISRIIYMIETSRQKTDISSVIRNLNILKNKIEYSYDIKLVIDVFIKEFKKKQVLEFDTQIHMQKPRCTPKEVVQDISNQIPKTFENEKLPENNKELKEQNIDLEQNNAQLELSITKMRDKLKKNDVLYQVIDGELEANSIVLNEKKLEFNELNEKLISIKIEIAKLKEELEPYQQRKQQLSAEKSKIKVEYLQKFDKLLEVVSENEEIIKDFIKLGFNDSDIEKSLRFINFNKNDASLEALKDVLDCPLVNWHSKFEYNLARVNLMDPEQYRTLQELSEKLLLVLLIPNENDRFNALEHIAQSEEENKNVERGRVIRAVIPGIKDVDRIKQKAKVILSK
jgi:hypothetical protein